MDHFVGIDVAKATLDIVSLPDGESWTVTNDDQGLAELAPRLVALGPDLAVGGALQAFVAEVLGIVRLLAKPFHDAHVHAHVGQEAHLSG